MGNVLSEEVEEETFLKEGFNLESPEADKEINYGASVPRCQPKHTEAEEKERAASSSNGSESGDDDTAEQKRQEEMRQQQGGGKQQQQQQQKMSYIQMARMGYQELVNAIIRPPRADYKVRFTNSFFLLW